MFKNIQYYQRIILLLWLGVSAGFAQAATDCNQVTEIPVSECQSLLEFYNSTGGDNWTYNTGWNQTNSPCEWTQVVCSNGHIQTLYLNQNNLTGKLPDLNLPKLTVLYLPSNNLGGAIPNFTNLPSLKYLGLPSNQLSGIIPNFTNLHNLEILLLQDNQLTGNIPNFSNLPNLKTLIVSSNRLTGKIPNFQIFSLGNLEGIGFSDNCGLIAYDSAQETILDAKTASHWRVQKSENDCSSPFILFFKSERCHISPLETFMGCYKESSFPISSKLKVTLDSKVITNRYQRLDLWIAVQFPNGDFWFRTSQPINPFKFMDSHYKGEAYLPNLEAAERTDTVLEFDVQPHMGGKYIFYALYVTLGKNPLLDGESVWLSNLAIKEINLASK